MHLYNHFIIRVFLEAKKRNIFSLFLYIGRPLRGIIASNLFPLSHPFYLYTSSLVWRLKDTKPLVFLEIIGSHPQGAKEKQISNHPRSKEVT